MTQEMKNRIWAVVIFVVVILFTIGAIQLIGVGIDILRAYLGIDTNELKERAETPDSDAPSAPLEEPQPQKKVATVRLLSKAYVPSKDVFADKSAYKRESVILALNGNFTEARLAVRGEVIDPGKHFLVLNYGVESGTLNAVRLSADSLDVNVTQERGGVFSAKEPMSVVINLFGETVLATTRAEFSSTKQVVKLVNPWKSNLLPPTVVRVLVAPFNEKGVFGGAKINELNFEYVCETQGSCGATICAHGQLFTKCLKDAFGTAAARSWCERAKFENCSSL